MYELERPIIKPDFREPPVAPQKTHFPLYRSKVNLTKAKPIVNEVTEKKALATDALALVLAGGRGSRLQDLTAWRAKPAVPFGGKLRIIDFPLSNCLNSGLRHIGILTQYKAHSLIGHVQKGWSFLRREMGEYVELLPAQQRNGSGWYSGTANAVYQNIDIIRAHNPEYVLILAGDHVYKMDYMPMLNQHLNNGADLTIGSIEVPIDKASACGVLGVGNDNKISHFDEKPENPRQSPNNPDVALASMGIYVFKTDFLIEQLIRDANDESSTHDFGFDIIPKLIGHHNVFAHSFNSGGENKNAYWRDVGTVDSYWEANMELISVTPELNLYDKDWPIFTHQEQAPPAKFIHNDEDRCGMAVDSMVAGGCIVSGSRIIHSLLSNHVCVHDHSVVKDSVLLPDVVVGKSCRLTRVVIDKGVEIPDGTVIGEDPKLDAERFYVSPGGVVLVTADMLKAD
jgi:glucose-1-phosphate adenylyltransferase